MRLEIDNHVTHIALGFRSNPSLCYFLCKCFVFKKYKKFVQKKLNKTAPILLVKLKQSLISKAWDVLPKHIK